MGYLNLDEIYALAVQIEGNAASFYRAAAEKQAGRDEAGILQELAVMEEEHKNTFAGMRARATAAGGAGKADELRPEGGLFLASIASGFPVEGSPTAADELTGDESIEDLLRLSIELEKEGILFYVGIKDVVTDENTGRQIDAIIGQEKGHIVQLSDRLKALRG